MGVSDKIEKNDFPVIGIGASAGGLEALEHFMSNVPSDSGMAYVIVQHLDPTQKGMLVELLQRSSKLQISQVRDGVKVRPDHVYVIPPNKDLSILRNKLVLMGVREPRGLHLSIDYFFNSLGADKRELAVGVILSGMGTDGTSGIKTIKERGGLVLVQDPADAKFDSMPSNAINTGLADIVAPAKDLPGKIVQFFRQPHTTTRSDVVKDKDADSGLEKILVMLRSYSGNDFSQYKKSTIYRRLERRLEVHRIKRLSNYVRFLQENPQELDLLSKELLIGVTSFFRDPENWALLNDLVLKGMVQGRAPRQPLRAWVIGCSTGEEAYSLAMTYVEARDELDKKKGSGLQIFATDVDNDAIEKARRGLYPESIASEIAPQRLKRFFVKEEQGYRVSKEIREMVIFAPQNIITDPPFTKLDIICCRNLMIYMESELQKRLIPLFHYSLAQNGVLFLGSAESIYDQTELFTVLDKKAKIFRRNDVPVRMDQISSSTSFVPPPAEEGAMTAAAAPANNLQVQADNLLLQRFSPPAVLVNKKGDVIYISGRIGKYLEPAAGKANWNIYAMAKESIRMELISGFNRALQDKDPVHLNGLVLRHNGEDHLLDVTVQAVHEPESLRGLVMMAFHEYHGPAKRHPSGRSKAVVTSPQRMEDLAMELKKARDEVQTTKEEMQTSHEELKSMNEELQSTNEELTTSKEEMQSLNEELQTVNAELQAKVDELSRSNNDMKNLLNSTDIATIFLDNDLNVKRYTDQVTRIMKLIPGDIGRPVTDLVLDLNYPGFVEDAREVLRALSSTEKEITSKNGRWYMTKIMPYRTLENVIDGVVITFTDITAAKTLEKEIRDSEIRFRKLSETQPQMIWTAKADGTFDYLSRQWGEYSGAVEEDLLGYGWLNLVHPLDRDQVMTKWLASVASGKDYLMDARIRSRSGTHHWFKIKAVTIKDEGESVVKWYGSLVDVEGQRSMEVALKEERSILEAIVNNTTIPIAYLDHQLDYVWTNSSYARFFHKRSSEFKAGNHLGIFRDPGKEDVLHNVLRTGAKTSIDLRAEELRSLAPDAEAIKVQAIPVGDGDAAKDYHLVLMIIPKSRSPLTKDIHPRNEGAVVKNGANK